jgi:hypothetical protein
VDEDETIDDPGMRTVDSVKDADAVSPIVSVAFTVYVPFWRDGIVNVKANEPEEEALTFPMMFPLYVTVTVEFG